MNIRKASDLKDMDILKTLVQACFGEDLLPQAKWEKLLQSERYHIFIAEEKNRPIGFIAIMHVLTLQYEAYWVDLLGVMPGHRNQGVAGSLLAYGKDQMEEPIDFVSALVKSGNKPSERALLKAGYEKDASFHLFFSKGEN